MAPRPKKVAFECAVCLEARTDRVVLECKHALCFPCAKGWQGQGKDTCPCCRGESAVLAGLKTRCPPLRADGVSRVAVKRRRSAKPHPTDASGHRDFHWCMGCAKFVDAAIGARDPVCDRFTCNTCAMILNGMNAQLRGCVGCMSAEMGLTVMDAVQNEGVLSYLGLNEGVDYDAADAADVIEVSE